MAKTVLITGITGFVAKHCTVTFLNAGYRVRGTLRDPAKVDAVRQTLAQHADTAGLEFAVTDLLSDAGWDAAAEGCDVVAHVAAPDPIAQPKDAEELIRPAVDGTRRVLGAATRAGVARVVHTSSVFATYYGRARNLTRFDQSDWTDLDGPGITPYAAAKTLAEQAARRFVAETPGAPEYVALLPGYIFGPTLDNDLSSSIEMTRLLMSGKYPGTPRLCLPCVDVRDVAKAHLAAAERPGIDGGRYLLISETLWMKDLAAALRAGLGPAARGTPRHDLPNWLVRAVGLFDRPIRSIRAELGRDISFDATPATRDLGLSYRPAHEAIVASGKSLIDLGLV